MKALKLLVVGAGSVGSVTGGMLAEAGHSVSLLGRQQHMTAIARQGLEITGVWGEHVVHGMATFTTMADIPQQQFDLILIATKSYDTEQAVKEVLPFISPDTIVISLQNGLGNLEIIANTVGESKTIGAAVMFGAVMQAPGTVEITVHSDKVKLGSPGVMHPEQVESIAEEFTKAGIPSEAKLEIIKHIWGKLLYNCCLNPLSAILECNYGELNEHQETKEVMSAIIGEIFAVARIKGVALLWQKPQDYEHLLFDVLIPNTSAHLSSMLQDIKRGKKTEIDAMNGAVYRLGREFGVDTPANHLLTQLVKVKEQQGRHAGISSCLNR